MCGVQGCANPSRAGYAVVGIPAGLCDMHHDQVGVRLNRKPSQGGQPGANNPYGNVQLLEDHRRLKALMEDEDAVLAALRELEQEVAASILAHNGTPDADADLFRAKHQGDGNYIRLSRVLERYERLCWFPPHHQVFVDSLTQADFLETTKCGILPVKDPGAGAAHGDLSHRLQWHAVMRVVTNGFTTAVRGGWHHSPLELFTAYGAGQAVENNSWGYTFDGAGQSSFCDPSRLRAAVEKDAQMPFLRHNLVRRYNKRLSVEKTVDDFLKKMAVKYKIVTRNNLAETIAGVLYRWVKLGAPSALAMKTHFDAYPAAAKVLDTEGSSNAAASAALGVVGHCLAWELWRNNVGKPVGPMPMKYDVVPTPLDNILGPIMSPKGEPVVAYDIDQAKTQSRNVFNPAYIRTPGKVVLKA